VLYGFYTHPVIHGFAKNSDLTSTLAATHRQRSKTAFMAYSSVVRIFVTRQKPDYESPWQSRTPARGTGSGVVIGPGKVLTGAHVVANATFVQVQKVADPVKAVARVQAISHDCDLALLAIDNPAFMEGVAIEELGELPELRDRVSVVGYPVGGEEISITEGVVSRIEVQRYSHSQRHLLAVTVDAAINRGNSGGPVFKDGKVTGIAFQTLNNAKNIGELVPAPIIRKFLEGIEEKRPSKIPGLSIRTQNLENPLLRKRAGLSGAETGVLVTSIDYGGSCWGVLEVGDALLAIDNMNISTNGTVQYLNRFRTRFNVVLGNHFVGDSIAVKVLRAGAKLDLQIELKEVCKLVPRRAHDKAPTYFIYGGLVFQVLCLDFLGTWEEWWENAPPEFIYAYYNSVRSKDRQEIIVLAQILADEINVGYEGLHNESVVSVNGVAPYDMKDFVRRIEGSNEIVEIKTSYGGVLVLEQQQTAIADERILKRYHINSRCSGDVKNLCE
jgi:S1-C subfamily serine protease